VVDQVVIRRGTKTVAEEYLKYLYSPVGQEIIARNFYRPRDPEVAAKYPDVFPPIRMVTIQDLGGWEQVQQAHFADGGVFDGLLAPR
jgi:ABC-type sulfate transport system substrate-binding protein